MKVLFSSNKNPHFLTITEYIEKALHGVASQVIFYDDRNFIIPGRLRDKWPYLSGWDLRRMNKRLLAQVRSFKPDLFFVAGGHRIFPETVAEIKREAIMTALWTIDPPKNFKPIIASAPYYDYIFTGGSEAYDILKDTGLRNLHWLPFACDPDLHKPQTLTKDEANLYSCDIAFVGTVDPELYPRRCRLLEAISDFDLGVWGPSSEKIPPSSPLKHRIRGGKAIPAVWTKIYSRAKIVLCLHYQDPTGETPCQQASPRIFEALACGAFVISDNQRDVFSLFKEGEHLAGFNDSDDLSAKITYYLDRPLEREEIARRGRREVISKHTYVNRIQELLSTVSQNEPK